jgi:hypothetical protein
MKQVPRHWLTVFGPQKASFLWGISVGLAFTTMIQYSLYYVVTFWIFLAGQPLLGALALAVYGFAQGALLTLEVLAVKGGLDYGEGLLGAERSAFFLRFGGVLMVTCGVFLVI